MHLFAYWVATANAFLTSYLRLIVAVPRRVPMANCVLLVDDNRNVRHALRSVFESAGFAVCGEAEDGSKAIEQAPRLRPDLIVLDLAMPNMNGLQAAPRLRKMLPSVPIILFTLHAGNFAEREAKEAGITAVVSKGQPLGMLVGKARELLS